MVKIRASTLTKMTAAAERGYESSSLYSFLNYQAQAAAFRTMLSPMSNQS
jgi:hypothetical protein